MSLWHRVVHRATDSHDVESFTSITAGLAEMYRSQLLPLEKDYKYSHFYSPIMTDGDFMAKPMVLLLGQYSTGKTTFVRHLLERDYPGLRIGPEPTTDKFVAVCHSDRLPNGSEVSDDTPPQVLPGHAAVVDRKLPWSQLENFGPGFLSRFEVVHVNSTVFKGVTLIDSPGVLAGNKQWERGYDFEGVIRWFAERVDVVLLFFDAHKLDISDEFRRCIQALKGNDSKVCILLNKADSVSAQQLLRVYGALMWSLGKVMPIPEVPKIHIGSFWDQPLQNEDSRKLFEAESDDLFKLIFTLPARSAARKIDDFLKRVRLCRVHCLLMDHLRRKMPFIGKSSAQTKLVNNLPDVYQQLSKIHQLPLTDFPPADELRNSLIRNGDFHKFPKLDYKCIRALDQMLQTKVAALTRMIPHEEAQAFGTSRQNGLARSPFFSEGLGGPNVSVPKEATEVLEPELQKLDLPPWAYKKYLMTPPNPLAVQLEFEAIGPDLHTGLVSGVQAKSFLEKSKLPTSVLHRVWNLADATRDGYLDLYEYALACHFTQMKLDGFELPPFLPRCLHPDVVAPRLKHCDIGNLSSMNSSPAVHRLADERLVISNNRTSRLIDPGTPSILSLPTGGPWLTAPPNQPHTQRDLELGSRGGAFQTMAVGEDNSAPTGIGQNSSPSLRGGGGCGCSRSHMGNCPGGGVSGVAAAASALGARMRRSISFHRRLSHQSSRGGTVSSGGHSTYGRVHFPPLQPGAKLAATDSDGSCEMRLRHQRSDSSSQETPGATGIATGAGIGAKNMVVPGYGECDAFGRARSISAAAGENCDGHGDGLPTAASCESLRGEARADVAASEGITYATQRQVVRQPLALGNVRSADSHRAAMNGHGHLPLQAAHGSEVDSLRKTGVKSPSSPSSNQPVPSGWLHALKSIGSGPMRLATAGSENPTDDTCHGSTSRWWGLHQSRSGQLEVERRGSHRVEGASCAEGAKSITTTRTLTTSGVPCTDEESNSSPFT